MSTNQSRRPDKKAKKKTCNTDWPETGALKFPWKPCSNTHLPFLSSDPKILRAFPKPFPTKLKPLNAQQKKKWCGKKSERRGEERRTKINSQDRCVVVVFFFNPKTKICFLRMPGLPKLIFCSWIRRPRSVRPGNRFVVRFSFFQQDDQKKHPASFKTRFSAKFPGLTGKKKLISKI